MRFFLFQKLFIEKIDLIMKKTITESQLRNIIAESVKKFLKEMREMNGPFYWSISLMEGEEVSRCGRLGNFQ